VNLTVFAKKTKRVEFRVVPSNFAQYQPKKVAADLHGVTEYWPFVEFFSSRRPLKFIHIHSLGTGR
jgi:hypothetical protein